MLNKLQQQSFNYQDKLKIQVGELLDKIDDIPFSQQSQMKENQQSQKQKKAKIDAEVGACTCLLIYFVVKAIVLLILYKYDNLLKHQPTYIVPFVALLIINSYLMLTLGKDPGFETTSFQQNELLHFQRNSNNFCSICNCRKKNRTKHCFQCGKCVRKFDHHCPWIGACVGEKNHFKFWILLLTHTLQSCLAFYILFQSMNYFEYSLPDGSFSPEYGAFAVFSFFMLFYIGFAGCLFAFHGYLLLANITSRELLRRRKCMYLSNVKGNPFFKGLIQNLKMAIFIEQDGRYYYSYKENGSLKQNQTMLKRLGLCFKIYGKMIIILAVEITIIFLVVVQSNFCYLFFNRQGFYYYNIINVMTSCMIMVFYFQIAKKRFYNENYIISEQEIEHKIFKKSHFLISCRQRNTVVEYNDTQWTFFIILRIFKIQLAQSKNANLFQNFKQNQLYQIFVQSITDLIGADLCIFNDLLFKIDRSSSRKHQKKIQKNNINNQQTTIGNDCTIVVH